MTFTLKKLHKATPVTLGVIVLYIYKPCNLVRAILTNHTHLQYTITSRPTLLNSVTNFNTGYGTP